MMDDMDDEFAEFDLTEDQIDGMMAAGTPVELVPFPWMASAQQVPYVLITEPSSTYGSSSITPSAPVLGLMQVSVSGAVVQTASLAA